MSCWNCSRRLIRTRLVPVAEAAELCEVRPEMVRQWMQEGDVEWLKLPTGAPLLLSDTLPTGERPSSLRALRGLRGENPGSNHEGHEGHEGRRCFVCGRPAEEERRLLTAAQVKRICRVQNYTLTRWMTDGLVEFISSPRGRLFYLDSLFSEPRRHRDLDVRGISRKGAKGRRRNQESGVRNQEEGEGKIRPTDNRQLTTDN